MKTAVAAVVRAQRSYRPHSRLRCLSTITPSHTDHRPTTSVLDPSFSRFQIAHSQSRFRSTNARSIDEPSDRITSPTEHHQEQEPEQSQVDARFFESRAPQDGPEAGDLSQADAERKKTLRWQPQHSTSHPGGYRARRQAASRERHALQQNKTFEPRERTMQYSRRQLGFTPQPLTFARGGDFDAPTPEAKTTPGSSKAAEEEEPVRPLTDRPMGSGSDKQKIADQQAKDEIAARKAAEPSYQLTFTCAKCMCCSTHRISKQGYHHGTVLVNCPDCKNKHLISDHLGIFSDKKVTLEDIMKEKGQTLKKGTLGADGDVEFY